jgi:O-antigen ligase
LAVWLAILPLLPSGWRYLDLDTPNAIDAAVIALAAIWLMTRIRGRRPPEIARDAPVAYIWTLFMVVVTGAALVGLASENRIDSPVMAVLAPEFFPRLLGTVGLTSDPLISARQWLTFVEGLVTFAMVRDCLRRALDTGQRVRIASWGWLAGLAVVSVFAIVQYLTRFQLHPTWVRANPDLVRAHASLDDPNMLGSYLLLSLGLAVGVALSERRTALVRTPLALAVLACLALLTTASRGAWVGFLLTSLFLISLGPMRTTVGLDLGRWHRVGRWSLVAIVALVALLTLARPFVEQRPLAADRPTNSLEVITQTLDPRVTLREVFRERLSYWAAALRMGRDSPITGIGLGLYPRRLPEYRSLWLAPEHTHNLFLQLLAETGIPGLTAFIALLAGSIGLLFHTVRTAPSPNGALAFGGLFGIVGFSITLLTSHALLLPSGQILFASALAIALSGSVWQLPPLTVSARKIRLAATVGAVMLLGVYAIAATRVPSPPRPGPWGYSWGYFEEEGGFFPTSFALPPDEENPGVPAPPGTRWARFRWTGIRSVLELQTPENASECVLAFASSLPSHGATQYVRIFYGEAPVVLHAENSDLNTVRIPLGPRVLDAERRLVVRIQVAPPFVPADLGLSDDRRQLGVLLFRPRCS